MSSTAPSLVIRDATAPAPAVRQFVKYAFYRVDPQWRRRSDPERAADRAEVVDLLRSAAERPGAILRTYSLVGTRGDADFLVWLVSEEIDELQRFSAQLNATRMGGWLSSPYHYFAMTKRSIYVERHSHAGSEGRSTRLVIAPGDRRFLFVYPFVKTRDWYRLDQAERQRQMDEHIAMGHRFPSVKINTTYSFGLDDQEFVVAFESDSVSDFLDLVQEMRASEASTFTVRDTPSFTCMRATAEELVAALG